jgi:hypothetical protein
MRSDAVPRQWGSCQTGTGKLAHLARSHIRRTSRLIFKRSLSQRALLLIRGLQQRKSSRRQLSSQTALAPTSSVGIASPPYGKTRDCPDLVACRRRSLPFPFGFHLYGDVVLAANAVDDRVGDTIEQTLNDHVRLVRVRIHKNECVGGAGSRCSADMASLSRRSARDAGALVDIR